MHETYLARLYDEARANGSLDDPMVADALAPRLHRAGGAAAAQPADADAPRPRRGAGARIELDQTDVDVHDPGHVRGGASS